MSDKDVKTQAADGDKTAKTENADTSSVEQSVDSNKAASATGVVDKTSALETSKDATASKSATTANNTSEKSNTAAGTGQEYVAPTTDDKSKSDEQKQSEQAQPSKFAASTDASEEDDQPATATELSQMVADSSTGSDVLVRSFEERLDKYIADMAPRKPITMEDAARNQVYLWDTLRFMLDLDTQQFYSVMTMTLDKIKQHADGVFAPQYLRRGFERMDAAITAKRRVAFDLYLNLLTSFATMQDKSRLVKYVDLPRTAAAFSDPKHQQRIQSFFGSFR